MAELPKNEIPAVTAALIYLACKREVSFATLARSSTSRCAIAAASGITSVARIGALIKSADDIGFKGIVTV